LFFFRGIVYPFSFLFADTAYHILFFEVKFMDEFSLLDEYLGGGGLIGDMPSGILPTGTLPSGCISGGGLALGSMSLSVPQTCGGLSLGSMNLSIPQHGTMAGGHMNLMNPSEGGI
jgi:hypothetical protein